MPVDYHCPLCGSETRRFHIHRGVEYFNCGECGGIHPDKRCRLGEKAERDRYLQHNNDVHDAGYRKFVSPITEMILNDFGPSDRGLDFGAGPGPVISSVLQERGYRISPYDPYFMNIPSLLVETYQYIVCCEVMEHFYSPLKEFKLLNTLLSRNGILYCKTCLYSDEMDFSRWYYINDSTHVFFYRKETIQWIQRHAGFSEYAIVNNVIRLVR